jgi:formate/nitrite transporter FocA (FNT family)
VRARAMKTVGGFLMALGLVSLFMAQVLAVLPESTKISLVGIAVFAIGLLMVFFTARRSTR